MMDLTRHDIEEGVRDGVKDGLSSLGSVFDSYLPTKTDIREAIADGIKDALATRILCFGMFVPATPGTKAVFAGTKSRSGPVEEPVVCWKIVDDPDDPGATTRLIGVVPTGDMVMPTVDELATDSANGRFIEYVIPDQ